MADQAGPPPSPPKSSSPRAAAGASASFPAVVFVDYEFDDDEGDSALGDNVSSSTTSVSDSILEYRTLHGRTYHSSNASSTEYWGPNDERQNESMDITHHVLTLVLDDKLFLAPIKEDVQKVLDIGTGTGIWAIDFADQFPSAEVIGTDISPIQPTWVPPNVKFEMDDCTQDWTWQPATFDFVHARMLFGSIADWPRLYAQAFRAIKPGGYFEHVDASIDTRSDDGSIGPGHVMEQWGSVFAQAGQKLGRSMTIVDEGKLVGWFRDAGFVDVVETRFKVPLTGWSDDPRQREIGRLNHVAADEGLEGYALYMLIDVLGWAKEECQVFVAKMRKAMKTRRNHAYYEVTVVYGKKP